MSAHKSLKINNKLVSNREFSGEVGVDPADSSFSATSLESCELRFQANMMRQLINETKSNSPREKTDP